MAFSRYARSARLGQGSYLGTSTAQITIRRAVEQSAIDYRQFVSREGDRLETLANQFYGSGDLWWVIAAASGIGWGLQMPPGTLLNIPDIGQVAQLVG